jgi:hypothetical protein
MAAVTACIGGLGSLGPVYGRKVQNKEQDTFGMSEYPLQSAPKIGKLVYNSNNYINMGL